MAECKPCHGGGKLYGAFGDSWDCIPCHGTGEVRTGPYRLADDTWSDGIDRGEPLGTRDMHYNRWEVWKNDWRQWLVAVSYPPLSYLEDVEREFPTHTEAIAYADRMARTNQGENK